MHQVFFLVGRNMYVVASRANATTPAVPVAPISIPPSLIKIMSIIVLILLDKKFKEQYVS
jgi:hypothetical protein